MERVVVTLGVNHVLDDVSLGVGDGDRIGVVGRNGGGKSTLMRAIARLQPVDEGRVSHTSGLTVGLLTQADARDPNVPVREVVLAGLAEHEWASDPRVRDVVTALLGDLAATGVGGWDAPWGRLSGGEARRVSLAALLVADPDLLLLDEPTNHLDVQGVAWLAAYLSTRRSRSGSALVVVTHDRWFLDEVALSTWEVHDGAVASYEGGYAAYVLAKAERERIAAVTEQRRENVLRKELAWLRRGPPARTSKPRFRIDAANRLIEDEPPARDRVALLRFATSRLGKDVVDLLDATVRAGDRLLLQRQTWRLAPGDRIGIVGVNGAGKSTLLRVVAGDLAVESGRRKVGTTVVPAYLSQDVAELDELGQDRVIDAITRIRSVIHLGDKELTASQLAQRLGFTGPRQQTKVADLSGGERRRLQLARLLMGEPNLLLLDEPTNDLDIETLTSLEDVLDGWPGTLLVVSHDRYLLERVCDRQIALFGDGRITDLPRGVEQYLEVLGTRESAASGSPAPERSAPGSAANDRDVRKELNRLERAMARLSEQRDRLHAEMAEVASDHSALASLAVRLRDVDAEHERLEETWLELAESVE
ncbi:MAG: ABC-F family ATP-binding cassette domain-containing protein [Austwickia sp.]|nr:ABC-F family ATP-binding cassette domain-containing protein [Austwickia sp.]MBK8436193.1 ABC-F family ATP-binding cassette domain-containing protein [Austwickia sp.]MBK9101874.1 ABC-F family ATP-binding cassette domain-containing protein [Austwickia sp.]